MLTWQEMQEKARLNLMQAQSLLSEAGDRPTTEVKEKVDALLAEAEDLYAKAQKLQGDDDRVARMKALQEKIAERGAKGRPGMPLDDGAGDGGEVGFKDWTEFLLAVKWGRDPRLMPMEAAMSAGEYKALAEGVGESGGYLVPTAQLTQLLEVAAEMEIVRSRAFSLPMASRTLPYPKLNQTGAPPSGGSAFFGGVVLDWFEENTDLNEEDVKFSMGELVAHGLGGWLPVSNSLIANSAVSLGAMIPRLFGQATAWAHDYAFLRGDGVAKPLGVYNAPATKWVNRDAADEFQFVDAVAMAAVFLASSWGRGVWVMHQTVLPQLYQMKDSNSNNIWLPNAAQAGPGMLLGMPIFFTEKLPALGDKGDVLLCDFGYYIVGDRQLTTVATSSHERFRRNQTTFRVTSFIDGQPWIDDVITLNDGSTEVSPFVGLDEAED